MTRECLKAAYPSSADADAALYLIRTRPRRNFKGKRAKHLPCGYYLCPHCKLWHLTSQEAS